MGTCSNGFQVVQNAFLVDSKQSMSMRDFRQSVGQRQDICKH